MQEVVHLWARFSRLIAPDEEPGLYEDAWVSDESLLSDFFHPDLSVEPVRLRRQPGEGRPTMTAEQEQQDQRYRAQWRKAYPVWLGELEERIRREYFIEVDLAQSDAIVDILEGLAMGGVQE